MISRIFVLENLRRENTETSSVALQFLGFCYTISSIAWFLI